MDLNASPEPGEEEVFPEPQSEEDSAPEKHVEYHDCVEHKESAVEIARREREERIQRVRKQRPDERPSYGNHPTQRDDGYQVKRQRPNSRLPPGWLHCPASGKAIGSLIPSKVPLGEAFDIAPGKRYSFRQVIHQQRASGREGCYGKSR